MDSGLRIKHIPKIGEKVRAGRAPTQLCAGLRTGNMGVPPREEPQEAEMLLGLFRWCLLDLFASSVDEQLPPGLKRRQSPNE